MDLYLKNLSLYMNTTLIRNLNTSELHSPPNTKDGTISFVDRVLLTLLYSLVGVVGLVLCVIITYTILRNKPLRTRPNILLLDLLISDILFIVLQLPYGVYTTLLEPPPNTYAVDGLCTGFLLMSYALVVTNIIALSVISLDRYLSVARPYLYHKYLHRNYFVFILLWPWIQSIAVCLPIGLHEDWVAYDTQSDSFCTIQWSIISMPYVLSLFITVLLLPLGVLFVTNSKVHRIARSQAHKARKVAPVLPCEEKGTRCLQASTFSAAETSVQKSEDQEHKNTNSNMPCYFTRSAYLKDTNSEFDPVTISQISSESSKRHCSSQTINHTRKLRRQRGKSRCSLQLPVTIIGDSSSVNTNNTVEIRRIKRSTAVTSHGDNVRNSIIANVRRRASSIRQSGTFAKLPRPENIAKSKLQVRIALSTYFLIATFICCWFPFLIPRLVHASGIPLSNRVSLYTAVSPTLVSLFDPIIILLTRREIRKSVATPGWKRRHRMLHFDVKTAI